jgi:hypothetical protein
VKLMGMMQSAMGSMVQSTTTPGTSTGGGPPVNNSSAMSNLNNPHPKSKTAPNISSKGQVKK